jgi:acetylornithine/succinyldiaminopimelate/putrescine aminotransferase
MTCATGPVLALWAAPRWREQDGLEFLRILAALVAYGHEVRLVESTAGRGVLAGAELSTEAEAYVDALAASGVVPTTLADEALVTAVRTSKAIVRLAPDDRTGEPALLEAGADGVTARAVCQAGQVFVSTIRTR